MTDIFICHNQSKEARDDHSHAAVPEKALFLAFKCIISTRYRSNSVHTGAISLSKDTFSIPNKCETNGVTLAVFWLCTDCTPHILLSSVSSRQQ